MKSFLVLFYILLFSTYSFATSSGKDNASKLHIGNWYECRQVGVAEVAQIISIFNPDGTFHLKRHHLINNKPKSLHNESGTWKLKNNTKTMTTTHINGVPLSKNNHLTNSYRIINLSWTEQVYENRSTNNKFTALHVAKNFVFPNSQYDFCRF